MKKIFVLITVLLIFLSVDVCASDIQIGVDKVLDIIPDSVGDTLKNNNNISILELIKAPPSVLWNMLVKEFTRSFRSVTSALSMIVAVILLTTVVMSLSVSAESNVDSIIQLVCCLWTIFVMASSISGCILEGVRAINDCTTFMLSYIPIYTGISTAAGLPASSLIYHTTLMTVGQVVSHITRTILSPLIGVFLSLSLSGIISENKGLTRISSTLKKSVIWILTLMMTIFVGFVTMQSFISGVTDITVGKTAKFLIGSFVPVIGGVISDAVSVAKGSIGIIKATVGSIGIVVNLMFFFPILVKITVWRVAIYLGTLVGDIMGVEYSGKVLSAFDDTLVILTAIILSVALLFIISTGVILSLGVM